MEWTPGGISEEIEDRRDSSGGGGGFGGGGLGIGAIVILGVLSLIFHQNFLGLFLGSGSSSAPVATDTARDAAEKPKVQFVSFVLDDVQRTWRQILPSSGANYHDAHLVLYRDSIDSACGYAQSATGPFYCPGDQKVYLDLSFLDELHNKFGAPGDFAQAYVIAHELGHHVQNILGITERVERSLQGRQPGPSSLSVRVELQADCFAGVWGNSTAQRGILDPGDIDQGLNAAAAVGDDRLQRQARGRVTPESFTHGTSAQRSAWFRRGFESGRVNACDTFNATTL